MYWNVMGCVWEGEEGYGLIINVEGAVDFCYC